MARSIAHRGPDDEGYFFAGPLGLGFRRLSIIDLSGGHQPMSDAEETVWVVFNGEIYNFKELRAELEGRGHRFRTNSDTEVIVHGYKEWGTEVLKRLNGMFGLAIWDVARQRLVVARDAMGIKMVYYRLAQGSLTFGSEIRAVQAAGGGSPGGRPVSRQSVSPVALHAVAPHHFPRHPQARPGHHAGGRKWQNAAKSAGMITPRFRSRNAAVTTDATEELLESLPRRSQTPSPQRRSGRHSSQWRTWIPGCFSP